jgi:RES domain
VTTSPRRSAPAQQGPPPSLLGLPTAAPAGREWFREHGRRPADPDSGCWFWASLPVDPADGGRFDLADPEGTCYFADQPSVAAMERVGRFTSHGRPVPADHVDGRVVTTIETRELPDTAANLLASGAAPSFRITGELFTMSDYSVPQAWAAAIRGAGHEALLYTPRFSPGGRAIAAFGPAGSHPRPVVRREWLSDVLAGMGLLVEKIPSATAVRIVVPPSSP